MLFDYITGIPPMIQPALFTYFLRCRKYYRIQWWGGGESGEQCSTRPYRWNSRWTLRSNNLCPTTYSRLFHCQQAMTMRSQRLRRSKLNSLCIPDVGRSRMMPPVCLQLSPLSSAGICRGGTCIFCSWPQWPVVHENSLANVGQITGRSVLPTLILYYCEGYY